MPNNWFSQYTDAETFSDPSENSENSSGTRENTWPAPPLLWLAIEKLFCIAEDNAVGYLLDIFSDVPNTLAMKSLEKKFN